MKLEKILNWNSLSVDAIRKSTISRFRQNVKNSMIDGYNSVYLLIPKVL